MSCTVQLVRISMSPACCSLTELLRMQAEAARSVCLTALSATSLPLTLVAAATAWHHALGSVRKAYGMN